jgi:hypothetical protein
MSHRRPILYLCAGTQSSGSTLISWCFLQRKDMDGFLDQRGDILPAIATSLAHPFAWCKFTINTFRLCEAKVHFEDEAWEVRPLLVIRDLRAVFNSLITKSYGRNGTTAEEPPLRMRLRRFKEDWELFRARGWPTIRYESFVTDPEPTLREICQKMSLPWDDGMVCWPKSMQDITALVHGNATFRESRGQNLLETLKPGLASIKTDNIPPADLAWIENEFEELNRACGYLPHLPPSGQWPDANQRAIPGWENTRRYKKRMNKNLLARAFRAIPDLAASLRGQRQTPGR